MYHGTPTAGCDDGEEFAAKHRSPMHVGTFKLIREKLECCALRVQSPGSMVVTIE